MERARREGWRAALGFGGQHCIIWRHHRCASSPALQGANMPDPDRRRGSGLPSSINRRSAGAAAPAVPFDAQTAAAWAPLTSVARRAWAAPAAAPAGRALPPPRPSGSPASDPLPPPPSCRPRNQGFRRMPSSPGGLQMVHADLTCMDWSGHGLWQRSSGAQHSLVAVRRMHKA